MYVPLGEEIKYSSSSRHSRREVDAEKNVIRISGTENPKGNANLLACDLQKCTTTAPNAFANDNHHKKITLFFKQS
jgi:hypothetical protein